ncbi:MAG: hypothetical protein ACI9DO_003514 [Reinekea sp.]|uniref:DUF4266 domain-containing protein n=1 Tax=Reinekea sp. TaxID=1970455 RepID=UPI00398A210D
MKAIKSNQSRRSRLLKAVTIITAIMTLGLTSGCSSTFEPWVKPYERDNLADPIMSMNRNPVSMSYTHHAYQAREGARGAEGGAGGGCGCN